MHSSRMRTGRSLTICCSLLPGGGAGVCLVPGGVLALGGGSPCWGGLPGLGGFSLAGGVSLVWGGCLPGLEGGLSAWSGGSPETPPVNRITDTCKNITLATTSLRPVIRHQ